MTAVSFSIENNNNTNNKIIPITVISGFLGSGKTTLLQHLLHNQEGLRIAVIVNDVASVNIDSKLISGGGGSTAAAGMVELQNGCACCSLSDELLASVSELVTLSDLRGDQEGFHHIVVELSGVADPKSVRAKFQEAVLYDMPLMERVRLDTLTTVVDCSIFLEHLASSKGATPKDAPELFYRDGEEPKEDEKLDWMEGMPAPLVEALLAGERAYGAASMASSDDGVADLLVAQTETADVVLLNKVDLADRETSQRVEQVVRALNPRATVIPTEFGKVAPNKILASAGGNVALAGVVDDHRDAVEAAVVSAIKSEKQEHSHNHEHSSNGPKVECADPDCTDPSHSHSHSHEHSDGACTDPACTDQSHSHSYDHAARDCSDPDCTDPTHSHSHTTHIHGGIGTYVYRARRPFHPGRLVSFLRLLPVTRGLPDEVSESEPLEVSGETEMALKSVLRSKGFVWCADSNVAALYWSQAGSSFEMQCLGRWWATLPKAQWPEEAVSTILADFDSPDYEDESGFVGDRRQEIVFIGSNMGEARKQNDICNALNQCLLSDSEWKSFQANVGGEEKLRSLFANPIKSRMASY